MVIAPYHRLVIDEATEYFLQRCAREHNIRLLLAVYAGDAIPEWAHFTHYKTIKLSSADPMVYRPQVVEGLGLNFEEFPDAFRNDTVLCWLTKLRELRKLDALAWRTCFYNHIHPINQSEKRNTVRGILNVLQDLLPALGEGFPDCVALLKVMSVMLLPRSQRLVTHLWKTLRANGVVTGDQQEALQKLVEFQLIDKSADGGPLGSRSPPDSTISSTIWCARPSRSMINERRVVMQTFSGSARSGTGLRRWLTSRCWRTSRRRLSGRGPSSLTRPSSTFCGGPSDKTRKTPAASSRAIGRSWPMPAITSRCSSRRSCSGSGS